MKNKIVELQNIADVLEGLLRVTKQKLEEEKEKFIQEKQGEAEDVS